MMRITQAALLSNLLIEISCNNAPKAPSLPPPATSVAVTTTPQSVVLPIETTKIYLAGSEEYGSRSFGTLWVNGNPTSITNQNRSGSLTGVALEGDDVYLIGSEYDFVPGEGLQSVSYKIWKNGVATTLLDGYPNSKLASIAISNGDSYVVGHRMSGHPIPILWKNGVSKQLSTDWGVARSVIISDGDVYVAGWELRKSEAKAKAILWKNDRPIVLTNGTKTGDALALAVSGKDVYVVVQESALSGGTTTKIWKNESVFQLKSGKDSALGQSIVVSGKDVYVAGWTYNAKTSKLTATLWKNGIPTFLSNSANNTKANLVTILGTDIYVAGSESISDSDVAKLWKNGNLVPLSSKATSTEVSALVVRGPK